MTRQDVRWIFLAFLGFAAKAQAQTVYCYPLRADSLHNIVIENIKNYAADTDSSWTAAGSALGFPRVSPAAITLITNESVCQAAAQAFVNAVPGAATTPPSGKVYVFAVGTGHYYVVDPDYRITPTMSYEVLFTTGWSVVKRLGH